jgi:hypothetical protein
MMEKKEIKQTDDGEKYTAFFDGCMAVLVSSISQAQVDEGTKRMAFMMAMKDCNIAAQEYYLGEPLDEPTDDQSDILMIGL